MFYLTLSAAILHYFAASTQHKGPALFFLLAIMAKPSLLRHNFLDRCKCSLQTGASDSLQIETNDFSDSSTGSTGNVSDCR